MRKRQTLGDPRGRIFAFPPSISVMNWRERIRFWFDDLSTPMGKAVDFAVITLILLSCGVLVAETYVPEAHRTPLLWTEGVIMALFIVEYLMRLWSAEHRVRHVFRLYSLIDLAAILPVILVGSVHLQVVRVFRVLRIMRLLRFLGNRHFFFGSIHQSHLAIVRIIYVLCSIIFVASGFFWHFERGENLGIKDFDDAVYFSVVTITTVGFGDIVPVSRGGRVVTLLMILAGIIFIPWEVRNLLAHAGSTGSPRRHCLACGLASHDADAHYCKLCGARLGTLPAQRE